MARSLVLLALVPALALAGAGDLDPTFGTRGVVRSFPVDFVSDLATQPDGRIVVAAARGSGGTGSEAILVRFLPDGRPDTRFGSEGTVVEPLLGSLVVAVEPDGALVAAGTRHDADGYAATLRRYDAGGRPDPAFGVVERVVDTPTFVQAIARQPDGRLVLAGNAGHAPAWAVWVARYGPDGAVDSTFGTDGLARHFLSPHGSSVTGLVVRADGAIGVGAVGHTSERTFPALLGFTADGLPSGDADPGLDAPRVAASGAFVVVAGTRPPGRIGVARFDAALVRDTGFTAEDGPAGSATDLSVDAAGRAVVSTALGEPGNPRFALLRWNADGRLDHAFGASGVARAFPDAPGVAWRVIEQPDGALLAAGLVNGDLALARFAGDSTATTTTTPRGRSPTTTTVAGVPGSTTTLPPGCGAGCDDGDSCTVDRCDGTGCGHDPAVGFDAVACRCVGMPACGSLPGVARRVARACTLVEAADREPRTRARRLVQRAARILARSDGRLRRANLVSSSPCAEVSVRVSDLRERTRALLTALR